MFTIKKYLAGVAAAAALGVGVLVSTTATAPVAVADEGSYLSDLAGAGFGDYNAGQALAIGHAVCDGVAQGWTQDELINSVYWNTADEITGAGAAYIVEAAEIYLC